MQLFLLLWDVLTEAEMAKTKWIHVLKLSPAQPLPTKSRMQNDFQIQSTCQLPQNTSPSTYLFYINKGPDGEGDHWSGIKEPILTGGVGASKTSNNTYYGVIDTVATMDWRMNRLCVTPKRVLESWAFHCSWYHLPTVSLTSSKRAQRSLSSSNPLLWAQLGQTGN